MKNAVAILGVFFGVAIFGTLIGATIFTIYGNLTLFVAGNEPAGSLLGFFARGLIFSFPIFCILASLMSILFIIRHPVKSILPLVFLLVLNALFWVLLIPQLLATGIRHNFLNLSTSVNPISTDFFRESSNGISYFTKVGKDGKVSGIFIDTEGRLGAKGNIFSFENRDRDAFERRLPNETPFAFSDPIMQNASKVPTTVETPLLLYLQTLFFGIKSWKNGFLHWLSFISIVLIFCACYGLKNLSSWKLISGSWTIAIYGLALAFNGYARVDGFFTSISEKTALWWGKFCSSTPKFLSFLSAIDEPFIFFVNILVAAGLVAVGVIFYLLNREAKGDSEE